MSSFRVHFFHWIWSTKTRKNLILPKMQERLYPYMGGILNKYKSKLLEIGGISNHVHLLVEISNLDYFTKAIQNVKSSSTTWLKKEYPECFQFAWQDGFASYTVSYSQIENVRKYIQNQEEHHKNVTFEDEFIALLKKHKIPYDEKYIFD